MMKTWSERHEEIGEARGEARGRRRKAQDALLVVLYARFDPLPPAIVERVRQIEDEDRLDALLARAVTAASLADLELPA